MAINIPMVCLSKTEKTDKKFIIKMGIGSDAADECNPTFKIETSETVALHFSVGVSYRAVLSEIDEDLINERFLSNLHPELTYSEVKSLLKFLFDESTVQYKTCYGDGSIMFPKWKESLTQKEPA